MNRYRGILEAYIQTADRLLSDARKEVKTFEKIISSENLKLTPSMASYVDGYLLSHEYVVKKNLTRQEAFVDACLQPG